MPLSGVAMISENTAAASSSRLAGSLSAASSGVSASVVAIVVAIINFTLYLPSAVPVTQFFFSNLSARGRREMLRCLQAGYCSESFGHSDAHDQRRVQPRRHIGTCGEAHLISLGRQQDASPAATANGGPLASALRPA